MTSPEELLDSLNIKHEGRMNFKDDRFLVRLKDSNEYLKAYSSISNNDKFEYINEESSIDGDNVKISYSCDEYFVTIIGDMENDIYIVSLEEKN